MLNAGITPVVHEYGSLGCSGDLAPLAHCALALIGEGDRAGRGRTRWCPAARPSRAAGIEPLELRAKEGLALINGTDGMLGMLVLAIADLRRLLTVADVTAAMSVEALLGTDRVFAADLQALRPQPGQADSARPTCAPARRQRRSSPATATRTAPASRTPTRCAARPRWHGAARDTLDHADRGRRQRAGLGDRQPGGHRSTDGSSPTATSTARRSATCSTSSPSPPPTWRASASAAPTGSSTWPAATGCRRSWPHDPGVDSGLMIAQYTAGRRWSASSTRLAAPASVDSIPTSAMQEDHVSMGWAAARKLRRSSTA